MNETLLVVRDIPVWMDAAAVDRALASGPGAAMRLEPTRRMDRESAMKMVAAGAGRGLAGAPQGSASAALGPAGAAFGPSSAAPAPAGAVRTSLQLWDIADRYAALVDEPGLGSEARLRLGQTLVRLARPAAALNEFTKADQTGGPSVKYLARLFAGAVYVRTSQFDKARASLAGALTVVPRAQAATFTLAPLLVEASEGEEAADLLEAALRAPVAQDPFQNYWSGDPALREAAIQQLREALQ
jgi:hypothetical protein